VDTIVGVGVSNLKMPCRDAYYGDVVHIEVGRGVVVILAAWMLDRGICAGMELGAPQLSVAALLELQRPRETLINSARILHA
jgi:hypothetical protein